MELGKTTANCFCLTYTLKGSDCVVSEDSWFNSIKSAKQLMNIMTCTQ